MEIKCAASPSRHQSERARFRALRMGKSLDWVSFAIWVEPLIGFVLPFGLLLIPSIRNTLWGPFTGSCLFIFGNLMMRNNITVVGMELETWHTYFSEKAVEREFGSFFGLSGRKRPSQEDQTFVSVRRSAPRPSSGSFSTTSRQATTLKDAATSSAFCASCASCASRAFCASCASRASAHPRPRPRPHPERALPGACGQAASRRSD